MSEIIVTNPAAIVVQVKGGKSTAIVTPGGLATKLVQLSDVSTANLQDGEVLTYVSANGDFEFQPQASASATDQFARDRANGAYTTANGAYLTANGAYGQANIATTNADAAFLRFRSRFS